MQTTIHATVHARNPPGIS